MSNDFVHLHVHSHYSLLDAVPKINELVKAAKSKGFKTLALTDHANLYGAIEFYEACKKEGIKPIIGAELYVTLDDLNAPNIRAFRSFELVVLAKNYVGYKNLLQLVSLAQTIGRRDKPLLSRAMLQEHSAGLIGLSGCINGEVANAIHKENNLKKAESVALEYAEIFGEGNFYLELNDLPALPGQIEVNAALVALGKTTGLPLVVTRDTHYLEDEDAEAQDVLTCISAGRVVEEPNRPTMVGVDYSLCSGQEVASRFKHLPEAIANTVKIAEQVNLELKLNEWHFAAIDIPTGYTADEFLRAEVYRRLPSLLEVTDAVQERVEYELSIIIKKGYSPYFLVVSDYVLYARDHGIIETTRGSAAGSIVSYALGITNVNPLYFKLPFERFLTVHRPSPPDVDADFADDRRDEMIAYVTKKYGADKVAQIITFGTMAARAAVRDCGRALGYSYGFCDQVAKLIPFGAQGFQITIKKALDLEPELKKLYAKNPQVEKLLNLAQKIEGCARHTSVHAAGVVISPTPLTDFTPVQYETDGGKMITQYEMHAVEAAGLLKMDFLGIRNLSILGHAVEIVEKTTGKRVDIHNLYPWDDAKTYEMLARGETVGVFQLSSSGMTRYLKELKPSSIFDIMAMVALFRPGPMESIPEYIRRKLHPELVEYLDPRMKDYLDQSLGLIVYQDDVLLTAINLAGYNWEEADKFRKAMGKKIPAEMSKQKEKFFKGCREFGKLGEAKINLLWERIEPFAAYGFNKAHAASYGVVAYQTAFMKANFPIQYMTAVLIAESGDIDKVPPIIHECERLGIKVLPPDINQSFKSFAMAHASLASGQASQGKLIASLNEALSSVVPTQIGTKDEHIRFGLNGIKNLGEHIADVIYRTRKAGGSYKNLEDFLTRVQDKDLNKKSLESLIKCGALDSLGHDRGLLLANVENMLDFLRAKNNHTAVRQDSLFSGSSLDAAGTVRLNPAPNATEDDKLHWEKELLGLYVTAHPFKDFQEKLGEVLTSVSELGGEPRNTWVVVGGVVDSLKKKITRKGEAMMFVTIQDISGSLELLVFPRTLEATKDVWQVGENVCVVGKTSAEEGDDKLFVEKAYRLNASNIVDLKSTLSLGQASIRQFVPASFGKIEAIPKNAVVIKLTAGEMKTHAEELKKIFSSHPGNQDLYVSVGSKKIKTSYKISTPPDMAAALSQVLNRAVVI
ncbi:MAG: DNA polymerase III subunit alpha [Candidatus Magasanikbacteria bacterium]|nr:DNA polymerase III subunit alpha [Candidatus Magasanikbacteria bacterium]